MGKLKMTKNRYLYHRANKIRTMLIQLTFDTKTRKGEYHSTNHLNVKSKFTIDKIDVAPKAKRYINIEKKPQLLAVVFRCEET